ncbi:carbon-nitrogen hydrolase family protein [Hoeflea poritis]|uniref:Carbon-nitrogen hydrolase family protein n=1 Tax=Hoeflea poritis TaxID=2993659 RepID=A0ABT4VQE9_9HYPH|nr:carbon-nitrogen hydrolase family protein [Hoeflea poritis]MDA4846925.1 carbon-nitrogen hydrolase family protein [Hoeflea poritis]
MSANTAKVRIASVQWRADGTAEPAQFYTRLEYYVRAAADYQSDFVIFPELFTLCLLSAEEPIEPRDVAARSHAHTREFGEFGQKLAREHGINIIAGSHLTVDDGGTARNTAFVFLRDGTVHTRDKLHPTPTEAGAWAVEGGYSADVIETDRGPIGVMICYDSEFPELARHLIDQGAMMLFVPYLTDTVHGHLRVRHCCAARTIENQCYVATAGMAGQMVNVPEQFGSFAKSAILTPSDLPFARDGIAAEASENIETVIFADLDLETLDWARREGSVRNLSDRRPDLYSVVWKT